MKSAFRVLQIIIGLIALLLFIAGLGLTALGVYEFVHSFSLLAGKDEYVATMTAISLLQAVDLFLIAIVLYVFSLGILILFNDKAEAALPVNLPKWLHVHNFMELKVILWEAILTTLVVSYLAGLAKIKMSGREITVESLVIPGAILLIALSLFFLKKGEK